MTVGPGTPSLEGPRTTSAAQSFTFLDLQRAPVDQHLRRQQPAGLAAGRFQFNNPLDEDAFDPSMVTIDSRASGRADHRERSQHLRFVARPRRGIATVSRSRRRSSDTFGQTLGKTETRYFTRRSGDALRARARRQTFLVCDPAAKAARGFSEHQHAFGTRKTVRGQPGRLARLSSVPQPAMGKRRNPCRGVWSPTRRCRSKLRSIRWGESSVDVGAALPHGHGNVIVQWESTIKRKDEQPDKGVTVWMQATHLGLMAEHDSRTCTPG